MIPSGCPRTAAAPIPDRRTHAILAPRPAIKDRHARTVDPLHRRHRRAALAGRGTRVRGRSVRRGTTRTTLRLVREPHAGQCHADRSRWHLGNRHSGRPPGRRRLARVRRCAMGGDQWPLRLRLRLPVDAGRSGCAHRGVDRQRHGAPARNLPARQVTARAGARRGMKKWVPGGHRQHPLKPRGGITAAPRPSGMPLLGSSVEPPGPVTGPAWTRVRQPDPFPH